MIRGLFDPVKRGHSQPLLTKHAIDGREWIPVPAGGQALFPRGFFENMAHTVILATEQDVDRGQIYNAADSGMFSLRQLVVRIGEILDANWEMVDFPRHLMPDAPKSQGLPFSSDPYDIEPHLLLDLKKIRVELGYEDVVPPDRALEITIDWLKDNPADRHWLEVDYPSMDRAYKRLQSI